MAKSIKKSSTKGAKKSTAKAKPKAKKIAPKAKAKASKKATPAKKKVAKKAAVKKVVVKKVVISKKIALKKEVAIKAPKEPKALTRRQQAMAIPKTSPQLNIFPVLTQRPIAHKPYHSQLTTRPATEGIHMLAQRANPKDNSG